MAMIQPFKCSHCDYSIQVSGKRDRGFHFSHETVHCKGCKSVYDFILGNDAEMTHEERSHLFSGKTSYETTKCQHCESIGLEKWLSENPVCPKCTHKMHQNMKDLFAILAD